MELVKHRNHRNLRYLAWLRGQSCLISGKKAECAHHVRLTTNGGCSIKPSDYFCIPLVHLFHTTGPKALHIIGEETFFRSFEIKPLSFFIYYLKQFLLEEYQLVYQLKEKSELEVISDLIMLAESNLPAAQKMKKKKNKSIVDNDFYQKSMVAKRIRDKELREKLKESQPKVETKGLKGNQFYENAKEYKREKDKDLRDQLKKSKVKQKVKLNQTQSEYYQKAKELKKEQDKALRLKHKENNALYQKKQREKMKELAKNSSL